MVWKRMNELAERTRNRVREERMRGREEGRKRGREEKREGDLDRRMNGWKFDTCLDGWIFG